MEEEFWNNRYASEEYIYGTEPNRYFQDIIDTLEEGSMLLPAEGEGRNAVYAAGRGWTVDAFDISEEGRNKALRLAEQHHVAVNYFIADFGHLDLQTDHYYVIALINTHIPQEIRLKGFEQLKKSLKKDGLIIIEGFSVQHHRAGYSFGPQNEGMLYDIDTLRETFEDYDIQQLEEREIDMTDGGRTGRGIILRMIARKK